MIKYIKMIFSHRLLFNLENRITTSLHDIWAAVGMCTLSLILITLITHMSKKAAAAKSLQSCPTVQPHRRQPTRLPVPGILQARTLEWVAISFSNAWKWKVKVKSLCRAWLLATPWTAAHQAPPSMGFSRQEYWSGVPLPSQLKKLLPLKNAALLGSD